MLDRVSSAELTEWMGLYQIEAAERAEQERKASK